VRKVRGLSDGDDTWWKCRHNYFRADWACGLIIADALSSFAPSPHSTLHLAKRIERAAMRERGYRFTQFEDAWVETYRRLAEQHGISYEPQVATAVFQAAAYVKQADYPIVPEAHVVLSHVRYMVESLHLVSLGDREFQMDHKIRPNGLEHCFESIHITQGDKGLVMQELADPNQLTFMVGDNYETDIRPALDLGLTAIWIHNDSLWSQSDDGLDPRVHVIHHLRELPAKVQELASSVA
jgi:FMN phosphatase YigB (HAD superfamily)